MQATIARTDNVIELPAAVGKTDYFSTLDLLVMDVLTPLIGFERGSYALSRAGYRYIGNLASSSEEEISNVAGMLPYKVKRISSFLRRHSLEFGTDTSEWRAYKDKRPTHNREHAARTKERFLRLVV